MLKNVPVTALLLHVVIILNAKFEVYSFNRPGEKRKCQNSESGSRDPRMAPFDLILHFFPQNLLPSVSMPNLMFLASTVTEIPGGHEIPKVGHMTPT